VSALPIEEPEDRSWHPEQALIDHRDPERTRGALRQLGDDAWRLGLRWLYGEALERPTSPETYPELRTKMFGPTGEPAPAPETPAPYDVIFDELRTRVMPHLFSAHHPRSFGYFTPPPLPIAVVGETLSALWQQSVDVWHISPGASLIEEEVISWLRDLIGFGARGDSWGVLTSGGTMANLMALALARDAMCRDPGGRRGAQLEGFGAYVSDQCHFSVGRALSLLGFPQDTLRVVESDGRFRLQATDVSAAIARDRAAGRTPLAIVAGAGTTNTGSVDEIAELATVARSEDAWLHVDAAYGGAALFSPFLASLLCGIEQADSVTVDPHKWLYQPHDVGALLVKRRQDLERVFARRPEYLRSNRPEDEPLDWFHSTMEGTRRFRALKLWMSWRHLGSRGFRRLVEDNVRLAAYLAERCSNAPDFEVLPVEGPALSVVCFRHIPVDVDPSPAGAERLDRYQTALQRALEVSGEAWVSTTYLRERVYLRAGVINHMSNESDIDRLLDAIRALSSAALEGVM
jgi:glutamate/tyrosine decarboxylase-like PLP-dependent enzyme